MVASVAKWPSGLKRFVQCLAARRGWRWQGGGPFLAAAIALGKVWKAWIGVDLVDLQPALTEAVIDAPEIEAADAKDIGKVVGMRIAADEIEFLLGLGGADRGGVSF
ncbi:hypothetical protein [Mesorhizobium loti]|uniref:hypothetical protein n=1 Tax=Rhizobium loti TaxID=381 RepID=UPI00047E326A|nr:hypothetical protein [Mesorhizobium loti]